MKRFFSKILEEDELLIAANEANFPAVQNISFKTTDCSSKLITKLSEPKLSLVKMKNGVIILN